VDRLAVALASAREFVSRRQTAPGESATTRDACCGTNTHKLISDFGLKTLLVAIMTPTKPVRYSGLSRFSRILEMNSSELVAIVAEAHDFSKAQAQAILDSVLKNIVKAAASDDEVSFAGFGKFKVKASPEREGRNPG
jgi:DNA-binding protein HU-beta